MKIKLSELSESEYSRLTPRMVWNYMTNAERINFSKSFNNKYEIIYTEINPKSTIEELTKKQKAYLRIYRVPKNKNIMKDNKPKLNQFNINTKNIHAFLNSINETEFSYIISCLRLAERIKEIIKTYNVSKETFCQEMKINKTAYKSYISGSRNYDLKDMSRIDALHIKLSTEALKKRDKIVSVSEEKNS